MRSAPLPRLARVSPTSRGTASAPRRPRISRARTCPPKPSPFPRRSPSRSSPAHTRRALTAPLKNSNPGMPDLQGHRSQLLPSTRPCAPLAKVLPKFRPARGLDVHARPPSIGDSERPWYCPGASFYAPTRGAARAAAAAAEVVHDAARELVRGGTWAPEAALMPLAARPASARRGSPARRQSPAGFVPPPPPPLRESRLAQRRSATAGFCARARGPRRRPDRISDGSPPRRRT